jgi:hypothetical protein
MLLSFNDNGTTNVDLQRHAASQLMLVLWMRKQIEIIKFSSTIGMETKQKEWYQTTPFASVQVLDQDCVGTYLVWKLRTKQRESFVYV